MKNLSTLKHIVWSYYLSIHSLATTKDNYSRPHLYQDRPGDTYHLQKRGVRLSQDIDYMVKNLYKLIYERNKAKRNSVE